MLGVDQTGRLVVFELKRHTAYRDAVAQVIDYASAIENMGNDKLVALIAEHSGKNGIQKIDDFRNWYADSLEQGDSINSEQLDELLPPRMVLVGLGTDAATERMVAFLVKHSNLDISLLTFHSFMHKDQTLFAKQVEVLSSAARRQRGKPSPEEIKVELRRKAENFGTLELFLDIQAQVENTWPECLAVPWNKGFDCKLPIPLGDGKHLRYARVDPRENKGAVVLVFYPRAIELCRDEFAKAVECIQLEKQTWPRKRDPISKGTEIQFVVKPLEWDAHKGALVSLLSKVYEAWQEGT